MRLDVDGVTTDSVMLDVIYNVLSWDNGQFEFAVREVPYEDVLKVSITGLLLEHARFSDESER